MVWSDGDCLKKKYVELCLFVNTYFSINSILGVQCHKVKINASSCQLMKQYVIVLCKMSWVKTF